MFTNAFLNKNLVLAYLLSLKNATLVVPTKSATDGDQQLYKKLENNKKREKVIFDVKEFILKVFKKIKEIQLFDSKKSKVNTGKF